MSKTVLFHTIHFSIRTQFSSVLPIDRTLSGTTTPGPGGPGRGVSKGVLRIPQRSITETSFFYCHIQNRGAVGIFYSPGWQVIDFSRFQVVILKNARLSFSALVFLPVKLLYQGQKDSSDQLFTHSWEENSCIHIFPKGSSALWNANTRTSFYLGSISSDDRLNTLCTAMSSYCDSIQWYC